MVSIYKDADYLAAYKQKKRILGVYWGVTLFYAVFCIAWWIYYMGLPYNDPMQTLPKVCVYVATGLFIAFSFPYLGIKFSRVRRYFKMLTYVSEGLKNGEKNYFYCFEEKSLQKDNIDVIACIFETWSKKKQEWMDREVYFDPEMPALDFESGDYVEYIVQSNFIIQYNILEKKALEFEELEEEDEYEEEEIQVAELADESEEYEEDEEIEIIAVDK